MKVASVNVLGYAFKNFQLYCISFASALSTILFSVFLKAYTTCVVYCFFHLGRFYTSAQNAAFVTPHKMRGNANPTFKGGSI